MSEVNKPKYLSRAEAVEFLADLGIKTTTTTFYNWTTRGGGPESYLICNRHYYLEEDLLKFIESKKNGRRNV